MADKPIALKPIDIEHKFHLHKLQHKTQFMTKAFSSTAGFIGVILIVGMICIMKKRGRNVQTQPQIYNSRVTMNSLLREEEKSCDPDPESVEAGSIQRRDSNTKSRFY